MATILGITHTISSNTASALIVDGKIISLAEEERFTRKKHASFIVPNNAINFCIYGSKLSFDQIDLIGVGFSRINTILSSQLRYLLRKRLITRLPDLYTRFMRWKVLEKNLNEYLDGLGKPVCFVRHHIAHAASAYYSSGFDESNIISLDRSGGEESGLLCIGSNNSISPILSISEDQSIGLTWELITNHLGFRPHSDEGKIMGLAAYGTSGNNNPFSTFVNLNGFVPTIRNDRIIEYLKSIPRRKAGQQLTNAHKNLAACLQDITDKILIQILTNLYEKTKIKNFCLSGGVALNCSTNGKLAQLDFVKNLFIQPASSDAGTALGAALYLNSKTDFNYLERSGRLNHLYWGPKFTNHTIEKYLRDTKISTYKKIDSAEEVAILLTQDKVIGWFQEKMEFGSRALGNRSILSDPRKVYLRDKVNKIKGREMWRPLSPSILIEYLDKYVVGNIHEPDFMIIAYQASTRAKKEIPAVIHKDGTLRPQAVNKRYNSKFWRLINSFYLLTDVPALLNTSFNLAGEPIVMSPQDAISTFFRSGLDNLVIGNYLVWK